MLRALLDRPDAEQLERFLQRLLKARGEEVEFVVLFGSTAKGEWSRGSDYDVLIGLRGEDGKRLLDRMAELSDLVEGSIEVFPYSRSEWQRMFEELHLLMLEVLEYGLVLFDRGAFAEMRKEFQRWREDGTVVPSGCGWRLSGGKEEQEERALASRH